MNFPHFGLPATRSSLQTGHGAFPWVSQLPESARRIPGPAACGQTPVYTTGFSYRSSPLKTSRPRPQCTLPSGVGLTVVTGVGDAGLVCKVPHVRVYQQDA